jgi:hypothetical protein
VNLLESHLDDLCRRLSFLPEAERDAEIAELRSHLVEQVAVYESIGETPEQAFASSIAKFGDQKRYRRAIWLRYYISRPMASFFYGVHESAKLFLCLSSIACTIWLILVRFFDIMPFADLLLGVTGPTMIQISYRIKHRTPREKFWSVAGAALILWAVGFLSALVFLPKDKHNFVIHWQWIYFFVLLFVAYFQPFKEKGKKRNEKSTV